MVLVLATGHDTLALTLFVVLVAATVAIAWRSDAALAAVPAAVGWSSRSSSGIGPSTSMLPCSACPTAPVPDCLPGSPIASLFGAPLMLGGAFALLFARCRLPRPRPRDQPLVPAMLWAASAVFAPLAILIALYYRIAGFERSLPFAGAAVRARRRRSPLPPKL